MTGSPNRRPYWLPEGSVMRLSTEQKKNMAAEIRAKVGRFQLTYVWLINRLADEGLLTDKHELSSVLAGTRAGAKAEEILRKSVEILLDYETRMSMVLDP